MTDAGDWDALWIRLASTFEATAASLRECNPRLGYRSHRLATDYYLFSATASFGRDLATGDENVVLAFSIQRKPSSHAIVADISTEDGTVLAECDPTVIPAAKPPSELYRQAVDRVADFERLIDNHEGTIRRILCGDR